MFVGHAALAFALVAAGARYRGVDRERALVLAAVAAAFAAVPDVDILYALAGVLRVRGAGLWTTIDAFWATGNVVHRAVTHSLVLGAPTAAGVALATTRRGRLAGVALLAALAGWVLTVGGPLAGATAAVAFATAVGVGLYAVARFDLGPRAVLATAAAGLLTHPFGDVFTGGPPALLYPLDATLVGSRVALHPDPTLSLVAAFAVELATVWLAVAAYARLRGDRLVPMLDRRASIGAGYALAAFVLPPPTLEVSYHFVFTVLAVGVVGVAAGRRRRLAARDPRFAAAVTGLTAVTVALAAYAAAYAAL